MSFPAGVGAPNTGESPPVTTSGPSSRPLWISTSIEHLRRSTSVSAFRSARVNWISGTAFRPSTGDRPRISAGAVGILNQNEVFAGETAAGSTVRYDTSIMGVPRRLCRIHRPRQVDGPPPAASSCCSSFHVAAGFNHYSLRTTDTLTGTGAGAHRPSRPAPSASHLVPSSGPASASGRRTCRGMSAWRRQAWSPVGIRPCATCDPDRCRHSLLQACCSACSFLRASDRWPGARVRKRSVAFFGGAATVSTNAGLRRAAIC